MSLIDNQDFNLNYVSYVPMCLILSKHLDTVGHIERSILFLRSFQ